MKSQLASAVFARLLLALAMAVAALSCPRSTRAVPPPQFGAPTNFPTGSFPSAMIVADFNRDAKPDIAVNGNQGVGLLLGLGDGSFAATTNTPRSGPYLAAGDFNNDGNLDLVVASDYGGSVLLGDGRGNFAVVTNSVIANYPAALTTGDFNGDGKLDVASGDSSRAVKVAFGHGDGSFASSTSYALSNNVTDIRAGDMNGNGRLDLVVSLRTASPSDSNSVCVLTNAGGGTFGAHRYYRGAPGVWESQRSLELADLNHDGSLDLALLNYNAGSVTIRLNTGAGSFGPQTEYAVGSSPRSIAAADFNGDEHVDLLVRGGASATIFSGRGNGSFTVGAPMPLPSATGRPTVGAGDFNGDGMLDIAWLDSIGGAVAVRLNRTPPFLRLTPMPGYNQLSWLNTFGAGYTLECTTNLAMLGGWQPFPYPPVVIGNQKAVTDWDDGAKRFYRLRKP